MRRFREKENPHDSEETLEYSESSMEEFDSNTSSDLPFNKSTSLPAKLLLPAAPSLQKQHCTLQKQHCNYCLALSKAIIDCDCKDTELSNVLAEKHRQHVKEVREERERYWADRSSFDAQHGAHVDRKTYCNFDAADQSTFHLPRFL